MARRTGSVINKNAFAQPQINDIGLSRNLRGVCGGRRNGQRADYHEEEERATIFQHSISVGFKRRDGYRFAPTRRQKILRSTRRIGKRSIRSLVTRFT